LPIGFLIIIPKADEFSVRRQANEAPGAYALVRDWGERA